MEYCFDKILERRGTNCIKWDYTKNYLGEQDVLPLWVADMDFAVPPRVQEEMKKRTDHPIFGYSGLPESFFQAFSGWVKKRHDWNIENDWIIPNPGVVPAIALAINALTGEGDRIIIQPPVYPPFFSVVKNNNRELVLNPLVETAEGYRMDFEHLEKNIDKKTRMLVFCNPHNPVGRVWKKEELRELVRICSKNDILIISDEIWSDLIFSGHKHFPLDKAGEDISREIITCMAPSKTFNLAGLKTSVSVIPDEHIREKFKDYVSRFFLDNVNLMGQTAFIAVYENCENWLDNLLEYLEGNVQFLEGFIRERMPGVSFKYPEGTFVVWLDFRKYGLSDEELLEKAIQKAKVGLNPGYSFGEEGKGFLRINVGCPRATLKEAMERLAEVFE